MVAEEFQSKSSHFFSEISKVFSLIPVLMLIGFCLTFFIGETRSTRINAYNMKSSYWATTGRQEFNHLIFNLTDSSGITQYRRIDTTSGTYYPTRDHCRRKGDPKNGCRETEALYYDEDILWMKQGNYFTITNSNGVLIKKESHLSGSLNYTRNAKTLGCGKNMDTCQERCDELGGIWDLIKKQCTVEIYVDTICYRLIKENGIWVLDKNNLQHLPQNKQFSMYPSDGLGCDYGNNWNSIRYSRVQKSDVHLQLRSSFDSYIAASAYTRSCSNDYYIENSCFGLVRSEEKKWCLICIHISVCLIGLELIAYIVFLVIRKCAYSKAVADASNSTKLLAGI